MKKPKPEKYDWSKVDWSKPDGEIAKQFNCDYGTAQAARIRRGIPKVKAYTKWFESVDWTQSNHSIAKQFNKTETQVRGARQRYANGVRAKVRAPRKSNLESYIGRIQAHNDWRQGLIDEQPFTAEQLTNDLKRAVSALSERKTVHEWLNALGIPTKEETGRPMCLLRRLSVALNVTAFAMEKSVEIEAP